MNGSVFLNLTNHPSDGWPPEQTKAALALADQIHDIRFPSAEPEASTKALIPVVEKVLEGLPDGTRYALVQGDFTLTVLFIQALQRRGIACFAATSPRNSMPKGAGRKELVYSFVRFREYPRIV